MILRSTQVLRLKVAATLAALLLGACGRGPSPEDAAAVQALEARIAALEQRKVRIEDVNAIERLQAAYGYYADRGLWEEAADLFADDMVVGVNRAHGGIHRLLDVEVDLGDGGAVDLVGPAQLLRSEVPQRNGIGGVGQAEGRGQLRGPRTHGLRSSLSRRRSSPWTNPTPARRRNPRPTR